MTQTYNTLALKVTLAQQGKSISSPLILKFLCFIFNKLVGEMTQIITVHKGLATQLKL